MRTTFHHPEKTQVFSMSLVCPLDFRYGNEEMKAILSEENRLQSQLRVELALARAHNRLGTVPDRELEKIEDAFKRRKVRLQRVKEIEKEIRHDVMAVVRAFSEVSGSAGKFIHLGATSYDIVDSATAHQLAQVFDLLEERVVALRDTLFKRAKEHKNTVMLGRTHAQYATPITFGLKMAVFGMETQRHLQRLEEIKKRVCVGKMSGAVGSGAAYGPSFFEIQRYAMEDLGIGVEEAATQIVQRDRYTEFIALLANMACSLEKFATEVRNLQRSEIMEAAEAFDVAKQVGSSTMAHKKNPIVSENISGLARIARSFLIPTFENVPTWHERDLSNSSAERFIIPHTVVLVDDLLVKMEEVFRNLAVFPETMKRNMERALGLNMAESVLIRLAEKGMGRQESHELIRQLSMKALERGCHLREVLLENGKVMGLLDVEELDEALDPAGYIGHAQEIVDRCVKKVYEGIDEF